MINPQLKKRTILRLIFTVPLVLLICYLVTKRGQFLPDYQMYYSLFLYPSDNVEISFNLLTTFFRDNNLGFDAFLFLYALLGLGLHLYFSMKYVKDEQGTLRFIIFLIPYFCYFFILWDLIQIRYSAGISFLMFGIFAANNKKRILLFFTAFVLHNSMMLPIGLFYLFLILKNKYIKFLMVPGIAIASLAGLQFTRYSEKYNEVSNTLDRLNLLGGNCLMLYTMVAMFFIFHKDINQKFKAQVSALIYSTLVLTVLIITLNFEYTSIANRLLALSLFFAFTCHIFIRNRFNLIFIFLLAVVFSAWNFNLIVLDPNSFFNTKWYYP